MAIEPKERARLTAFIEKCGADKALPVADRLQSAADSIAVTMKEIHGGNWLAYVDHEAQFVLVRRDCN